jgi:hypothetical protein
MTPQSSPTTEIDMPSHSRVIAMTLIALTIALPALSGAQGWTEQNINGLRVLDRAIPGERERAVQLKYGWYIETSYIDARGVLTAMKFTAPQWQASDRIDYVRDTNDDRVMDMGWTWIVGRGWIPWTTPTDIGPYKTLSDQERSKYTASIGTSEQELVRMYVTRADKMFETARQMMIRARSP